MDEAKIRSYHPDYDGQIEYSTTVPEKEAVYRDSRMLHVDLKERLRNHSIELYSHQAEAIDRFKVSVIFLTSF